MLFDDLIAAFLKRERGTPVEPARPCNGRQAVLRILSYGREKVEDVEVLPHTPAPTLGGRARAHPLPGDPHQHGGGILQGNAGRQRDAG